MLRLFEHVFVVFGSELARTLQRAHFSVIWPPRIKWWPHRQKVETLCTVFVLWVLWLVFFSCLIFSFVLLFTS